MRCDKRGNEQFVAPLMAVHFLPQENNDISVSSFSALYYDLSLLCAKLGALFEAPSPVLISFLLTVIRKSAQRLNYGLSL